MWECRNKYCYYQEFNTQEESHSSKKKNTQEEGDEWDCEPILKKSSFMKPIKWSIKTNLVHVPKNETISIMKK